MSSGRHSGGSQSRNSKNDSLVKKYRPLVPESLPDSALLEIIRKAENREDAISQEIRVLWDKEAERQSPENDFCVVEKKYKKKEAPPARADRGGRGGRGPVRPVDRAPRTGKAPAAATAEKQSPTASATGAPAEAKHDHTIDHLNASSFPSVGSRQSGEQAIVSGVQAVTIAEHTAPAINSVWGGGSSLAQKIKTNEQMKAQPTPAPKEEEQQPEKTAESVEKTAPKPASKPRSRRDRKGQAARAGVKAEGASEAVSESPQDGTETPEPVVEQNAAATTDVVVESEPVVPLVVEQHVDHTASVVEQQEVHVPVPVVEHSAKNFVTLGKWETAHEPASEGSFQFGSFGGESVSSPARAASPVQTNNANRGSKMLSKNSAWKSGDNVKGKPAEPTNSAAPAWTGAAAEGASAEFSTIKSNDRQNADVATLGHLQASTSNSVPPGLGNSQNADSNRPSTVGQQSTGSGHGPRNNKRSNDSDHSAGKQHPQSAAPPGINHRAPVGAASFGGIMPGGMMPNIPYGGMPYDIGHQAPSLHPNGSYGMMQPNFSGAAASLSSTQPTSGSPAASPSSGAGSSTSASGQQSAAGGAGATSSQHQGNYQSAPPGMPAYMYPYNAPYYGHQFYYGGQPQGYYNRGQPMYQQPPRYGGDGYGTGAHGVGGYPEMYGSQGAQFSDSQYGNTGMHHHGGPGGHSSERSNKQKGSSSGATAGSAQQSGAGSETHLHGGYPGYGGSYSARDGQAQYQYQGGWSPAPMMYPQSSPSGLGGPSGGGFQGSGGRGPHENSSKNAPNGNALNGSSGYGGSSGQYVSNRGNNSGGSTHSTNSSTTPGSNMQPAAW